MKSKLYRLTTLGIEQTLKMKFFIILNILLIAITIGYVNFDTVKQIIDTKIYSKEGKDILEIMLVDETGKFAEEISKNDIKNLKVVEYKTEEELEDKAIIEIKNDDKNILKVKVTSNEYIDNKYYLNIQKIINKIREEKFSEKYSISEEEIIDISKDTYIERIILKVDYSDYMKYEHIIFAIAFIMYMLFIFVASTISSTIGLEKISKTTEYMLTGISETTYLWYNILQVNIVFIIQMILGAIYFFIANIIKSMLYIKFLGSTITGLNLATNISFDPILIKIILLTFLQTILCILILSIIQAIMSSKVSNMTDISNSTMLVIMIVVAVCFISPNLINVSGSVNIFIKILSCMPVFSIVMLPKLILLHQIGTIGIILGVLTNVITLIILSIFGARWFKKGLLDLNNSKKSQKRYKDEIYDLNKTRFKETIFKISFAMLIFFVISNILGIIGALINSTYNFNSNIQSLINIFVWVLSILPSYLYLKPSFNSQLEEDLENEKKISIKDKINLILTGLFSVTAIQLIIAQFINENVSFDIMEMLKFDLSSKMGIALFIIHLSILPAIFEELLFRKAILGMLKRYGSYLSIIISAFCFGLMHQNITQFIFAFLMGIILGFITIKTKSIIPAIVIHFLNNFVAVIAMITTKTNNNTLMYVLYAIVILTGIISTLTFFNNIIKNRGIFKLENSGTKIDNVLSSIFSQFIVITTLILYIIVTIYASMVLF